MSLAKPIAFRLFFGTKPLRVLRKFSILLHKSVWQGVAEVREGLSFCLSLPLDDLAGGSTAFGSPAFRFPCTQLLTGSRAGRGGARARVKPIRSGGQMFGV